ncbi:ABC transporter permease [Pseudarthrobacter enclensis]|uniref:Ribose/xylose/arabinose/galactoside ABC-type transport system permease subunit n=1 Tax=Pseudarthrobacter enclensis TaxID=993070 RepID=A0ABT9RZS9_9MICC|nr:ABC transporter permease [Pseudarthrobacter enclensis]MDP9890736.1 ribose/xylose/arabinose/galactoside ABC-type transport system permease subunit [Pseudarthrobacter enclensis]
MPSITQGLRDNATQHGVGAGPRLDGPALGGSVKHMLVLSRSAVAALVILVLIGAVARPSQFLTYSNVHAVLLFWPVVAISASGQLIAIMSGGIDLSLPGIFSLTGATVMVLNADGADSLVSVSAGIAVGLACGVGNGLIVGALRVVPLAATLATMFLFGGLAVWITGGNTQYGSPTLLRGIAEAEVLGIPASGLLALVIMATVAIWLYRSVTGLRIRGFGDSATIEQVAGVRRRTVLLSVYAAAGALASVAALLQMGSLNSYYPGAGQELLLPAVAAAALGGASLTGGSGSVFGAGIAALVLALVSNVFDIIGLSPEAHQIGLGIVLLLALAAERFSRTASLHGLGKKTRKQKAGQAG